MKDTRSSQEPNKKVLIAGIIRAKLSSLQHAIVVDFSAVQAAKTQAGFLL